MSLQEAALDRVRDALKSGGWLVKAIIQYTAVLRTLIIKSTLQVVRVVGKLV